MGFHKLETKGLYHVYEIHWYKYLLKSRWVKNHQNRMLTKPSHKWSNHHTNVNQTLKLQRSISESGKAQNLNVAHWPCLTYLWKTCYPVRGQVFWQNIWLQMEYFNEQRFQDHRWFSLPPICSICSSCTSFCFIFFGSNIANSNTLKDHGFTSDSVRNECHVICIRTLVLQWLYSYW